MGFRALEESRVEVWPLLQIFSLKEPPQSRALLDEAYSLLLIEARI